MFSAQWPQSLSAFSMAHQITLDWSFFSSASVQDSSLVIARAASRIGGVTSARATFASMLLRAGLRASGNTRRSVDPFLLSQLQMAVSDAVGCLRLYVATSASSLHSRSSVHFRGAPGSGKST
jgi:hypothetical protein